ncbi:MAG: ABC transporter ATP-binding protein [Firmicutes bacterium]|nr:ABC transporter ATP-binding protein [Bacillota bacterium]
MLRADGLTKRFGDKEAVCDVSLTLKAGELFGFLGPNGAGKTTTIRMLAGLLTPTRGEVRIGNHDLERAPREAKKLLGYLPDKPLVYEKLTGREYIRFMMELYDMPSDVLDEAESYLHAFALDSAADDLISGYSHGMKQKIALIGQLTHRPRVLLLDEPTVGLDPKGARTLRETLRALCEQGVAVLISTHLLPVAEMMCDRIGIMVSGRMIASGTVVELQSRYHTDASLEDLFLQLTDATEGEPAG